MTTDRLGRNQKHILRCLFWSYIHNKTIHSKDLWQLMTCTSYQSFFNTLNKLREKELVSFNDIFKTFSLTPKGFETIINNRKEILGE